MDSSSSPSALQLPISPSNIQSSQSVSPSKSANKATNGKGVAPIVVLDDSEAAREAALADAKAAIDEIPHQQMIKSRLADSTLNIHTPSLTHIHMCLFLDEC